MTPVMTDLLVAEECIIHSILESSVCISADVQKLLVSINVTVHCMKFM